MAARDAFVAEIAVNFKNLGKTADEKALEVKLGRDAHVEVDAEGVVLGDKRTRGGPARDGLHHGRLDFGEAALLKKTAHFADDFTAEQEHVAGILADDEVDVTLAVTLLDVGEAVPLARDGPERFGKNAQVGKADGFFTGLGGEESPLAADEVADVEELPEFEFLFAEALHLRVDLKLAGFVLDVGEDVLAHLALGDEAARDANGALVGVGFDDLAAGLGTGKGPAERVDAQFPPRLQPRPSQGQ